MTHEGYADPVTNEKSWTRTKAEHSVVERQTSIGVEIKKDLFRLEPLGPILYHSYLLVASSPSKGRPERNFPRHDAGS